MTVRQFTFEDGTTGQGYVIDSTPPGPTNAGPLVSTAHPAHSSKSVSVDPTATTYQFVQADLPATLQDVAFRFDFYTTDVTPTGQGDIYRLCDSAGVNNAANAIRVQWLSSSQQFRLLGADGTTIITTVKSGGYAANTHNAVGCRVNLTSGAVDFRTYIGASVNTATETLTATLTAGQKISTVATARWCKLVTAAQSIGAYWIDDVQDASNPGTEFPILAVNTTPPPTANAGGNQMVEPGATVTLDGSGSSGATSYSWALLSTTGLITPTLSGGTTVNPTFKAPAEFFTGPDLTFRLTATNAQGSATDDVLIQVQPTTFGLQRAAGAISGLLTKTD